MSIKIVCGCGFATLVPSEWRGKRVRCKCGRAFIVGDQEQAILEPPAPRPALAPEPKPKLEPALEQEPVQFHQKDVPEQLAAVPVEPAAVPPPAPPPEPATTAAVEQAAAASVRTAETLYRERQVIRRRRRSVLAGTLLITALAMVAALVYVLRLHDWSLAALLQSGSAGGGSASTVTSPADLASSPGGDSSAAEGGTRPADVGASTATRLANLMPLASEDGLLLAGLFGDVASRLRLSDGQHEAIQTLVTQVQANEQSLRDKSAPMEQWYADARRLGDQLLAVLTDDQRRQLQISLERGEVGRVQLVMYAARMLPELAVPQVDWSVPTDGHPYRAYTGTSLSRWTGQVLGRAPDPTGVLATLIEARTGDVPAGVTVWDLAAPEPRGRLETDPSGIASPCLLSPDGAYVALTRRSAGTERVVEVWETAGGRRIASRALPVSADDPAAVRACTDQVVVATMRRSCWVWRYQSDELRTFEFPDARPGIAPGLVVSPRGKYLMVAHRYVVGDAPDTRCFLEVCVYGIDSGELLGNQRLHHEYRSSTISAMVLSHDGRELALLWDFDAPEPARKLVHMLASSGKIIRIVDGLRPPDPSDAMVAQLPNRGLICLPENAGWIVDLRQVVDAETGAVLPLDGFAAASGDDAPADGSRLIEVIPASEEQLLIVSAQPSDGSPGVWNLQTRSIRLPKLGPFQ